MLIAEISGRRVDATDARRDEQHVCPGCKAVVILKRGRIVVAHFAHKPPTICTYAGETRSHMLAKRQLCNALIAAGYDAQMEVYLPSETARFRPDILVAKGAKRAGIEIQHSTATLDEIEQRTQVYARAALPVLWLPLVDLAQFEIEDQRIERYPARPFERWLHALQFGSITYYDISSGELVVAKLEGQEIYVEDSSWFENGQEMSAGGYFRWSKRWRVLHIQKQLPISPNIFRIRKRPAKIIYDYQLPSCHLLMVRDT